ncbi:MAG TPA: hydantoinase/oxoprolinase family protein [Acidobacteriota bacterium]|nr:hydantoinase/oxoprolinase family protein [Acidobacteriota bacterium]
MLRIGIDTGGTFTDFVVLDDQKMTVVKLPSTPKAPERALLEGLAKLLKGREDFLLQHGSTVATNAFLERKGAKLALITNQGFEDLIEIGRQNRPELYNLQSSRQQPLVPKTCRVGVRERTSWDGRQIVSLEEKSLNWLKTKIAQLKVESIAVVLLYSFLKPENELRIAEALESLGLPISLSHRVLPEFREFERTSTTVVNAYVQPIMSRYLEALCSSELVKRGKLTVMQSNGGVISARSASSEPVRTLFSGPAGGVVGAFEIARKAGYGKVITFDMGGTSTDVCLCDGRIETTNESQIDHFPISIQMIGIQTVGAGGGSIAWVDEGGLLKVGPQSAGADPGPVCYGKGRNVTVTDANIYLERLEADYFLGGDMSLHPDRVRPALNRLGKQLQQLGKRDWKAHEIAEGIIRIVNSQMERALRLISLQRGYDTREFSLVAFGGAGGLHACDLARSLLIPRVIIPPDPGALSATGIVRSDIVQDSSVTLVVTTQERRYRATVEEGFRNLEDDVSRKLGEQDFSPKQIRFERTVDARYLGQAYELNIPYSENVVDQFHQRHEQFYGYASKSLPVEFVNLRIRGRASYPLPSIREQPAKSKKPPEDALVQGKEIFGEGKPVSAKFFLRHKLDAGNLLEGPCIVLEYSSTTYIAADFQGRIDRWLNLILEPREMRGSGSRKK